MEEFSLCANRKFIFVLILKHGHSRKFGEFRKIKEEIQVTCDSTLQPASADTEEASPFGYYSHPGWCAGRTPRWTGRLTKDNKRESQLQVKCLLYSDLNGQRPGQPSLQISHL